MYCTSLDFFQQALGTGDLSKLEEMLYCIRDLQRESGITLGLRALTRADSYMEAVDKTNSLIINLARDAGFYQFGFGADGAANVALLKAMRKGAYELGSRLIKAFEHAESHDLIPEILYVFGIPEDTEETLEETRAFCVGLLKQFPNSIYRGFPAKNNIPGNYNWNKRDWRGTEAYRKLLADPKLFANLGFEILANFISHPNGRTRKLVNKYAVQMSHAAHQFGRVQSFLTIPYMETNGRELMDTNSFELFRDIIGNYAPEIVEVLTLENLPEYREELNKRIPKDK